LSFAAMMLVALVLDVVIGWPGWLYRRVGHPVTWLDMGEDDFVICKYCDRVFKLDAAAVPGGH
jgi:hypothetical protein